MSNPKKLKIYIIAGESSGDYIGSKLIEEFLLNKDLDVSFFGVGGSLMQNIKDNNNKFLFKSVIDIKHIAIMGFAEVLLKIFKIKKLINLVVNDILTIQPDIVITIDSLGFNKRVIKKIKGKCKAKLIHYVAPTVWAWKPKRAYEVAELFDGLLCLFDFEKKYFTNLLPTYVVGHPIIESNANKGNSEDFFKKYNLNHNNKYILLMPGSRITEINQLLDIFIKTVQQLSINYNNIHILLPTVPHLYANVNNYVAKHNIKNITVINNVVDKYNAFKLAHLAIIASGTASLETSLANITTIVAYRVNFLSYLIAKLLIKVKYASIVNIIANKELIKEFIQNNCTIDNLYKASNLALISSDIDNKLEILQILEKLGLNNTKPSNLAMKYILEIYNNHNTN